MVFQDYALFPWMTVVDNVAFGLKLRGIAARQCQEIAREHIALVGLAGFENRFPGQFLAACANAALLRAPSPTFPKYC